MFGQTRGLSAPRGQRVATLQMRMNRRALLPVRPRLAFLVAPLALALHALGLQPSNPLAHVQSLDASHGVDPLAIWPLTLLGATATAVALLLLVRSLAARVELGYGTARSCHARR